MFPLPVAIHALCVASQKVCGAAAHGHSLPLTIPCGYVRMQPDGCAVCMLLPFDLLFKHMYACPPVSFVHSIRVSAVFADAGCHQCDFYSAPETRTQSLMGKNLPSENEIHRDNDNFDAIQPGESRVSQYRASPT